MPESKCRHLFPRAARGGYLDTAAEGLPAPGVAEAITAYIHEKQQGTPGRKKHFEKEAEARQLTATLLGTTLNNVAFAPSASDALNLLALSMDLHADDEIVITDLEFPSNVLPWLALKRRGVKVRVLPCPQGYIELQDIAACISERTRLVSISLVSYKSGARFLQTKELADLVHDAGGALCIDATQALGRCPVPLDGVDYLMSSSFKWLMAPHGLAAVYISPEFRDRFEPLGVGWYSVEDVFSTDRFDRYRLKPGADCIAAGMPNFASLYAMCEALRFLLSLDRDKERERVDRLSVELRGRLASLGVEMLTPANPALVSGIVAFAHDDAQSIGAALEREGITVWAGDNRVRASLHYYNDNSDVDSCTAALERVLRQEVHAG
jgi:cysteine desulfurase / selenocysteine lyase